MLQSLFARLTAGPRRGAALFDAATGWARDPRLYRRCDVPDTIDGRFAALATVTALMLVRLEQMGVQGKDMSVALTERFVEAMDAEHRQLGLSDPTLGKTVRKLVTSLAQRVALWRDALAGGGDWAGAAARSVAGADAEALGQHLRALWQQLASADLANGRAS